MFNKNNRIIELENKVNEYLKCMTLKELFSEQFIREYVKNFDVVKYLDSELDINTMIRDLNQYDISKINEILNRTTKFNDFNQIIDNAKRYLVINKLKELNLI